MGRYRTHSGKRKFRRRVEKSVRLLSISVGENPGLGKRYAGIDLMTSTVLC